MTWLQNITPALVSYVSTAASLTREQQTLLSTILYHTTDEQLLWQGIAIVAIGYGLWWLGNQYGNQLWLKPPSWYQWTLSNEVEWMWLRVEVDGTLPTHELDGRLVFLPISKRLEKDVWLMTDKETPLQLQFRTKAKYEQFKEQYFNFRKRHLLLEECVVCVGNEFNCSSDLKCWLEVFAEHSKYSVQMDTSMMYVEASVLEKYFIKGKYSSSAVRSFQGVVPLILPSVYRIGPHSLLCVEEISVNSLNETQEQGGTEAIHHRPMHKRKLKVIMCIDRDSELLELWKEQKRLTHVRERPYTYSIRLTFSSFDWEFPSKFAIFFRWIQLLALPNVTSDVFMGYCGGEYWIPLTSLNHAIPVTSRGKTCYLKGFKEEIHHPYRNEYKYTVVVESDDLPIDEWIHIAKLGLETFDDQLLYKFMYIGHSDSSYSSSGKNNLLQAFSGQDDESVKSFKSNPMFHVHPLSSRDSPLSESYETMCFDHLKEIIPVLHRVGHDPAYYQSRGLKRKESLLLYGPPGVGKSAFVLAVAKEERRHLLVIPPKLLRSIHSDLMSILDQPQIQGIPVSKDRLILLFDEIDVAFGDKQQDMATFVEEMLSTFDGPCNYDGLIILATTNHPEWFPKRLMRDLRLTPIPFPYPSLSVVERMFARYHSTGWNRLIAEELSVHQRKCPSQATVTFWLKLSPTPDAFFEKWRAMTPLTDTEFRNVFSPQELLAEQWSKEETTSTTITSSIRTLSYDKFSWDYLWPKVRTFIIQWVRSQLK